MPVIWDPKYARHPAIELQLPRGFWGIKTILYPEAGINSIFVKKRPASTRMHCRLRIGLTMEGGTNI